MNVPILSVGIACVIAAIVGGGMKGLGAEIPPIASTRRQITLGIFGVLLIVLANLDRIPIPKPKPSPANNDQQTAPTTPGPVIPSRSQPTTASPAPGPSTPIKSPSIAPQNATSNAGTPSAATPKASAKAAPPASNISGTWKDPKTGLIWPDEANDAATSQSKAADYCKNSTRGGLEGWQLPTDRQLGSLFSYERYKRHYRPVRVLSNQIWTQIRPGYDASQSVYFPDTPLDGGGPETRDDVPTLILCVKKP